MKIVTVTSDNYAGMTARMLESLRIWHPDLPVEVHALETGWTDQHTTLIEGQRATVVPLAEESPEHRNMAAGKTIQACWKLHVFAAQQQPFLFLDGDMLILAPLDDIFAAVDKDGWFCVHEKTEICQYNQGDIRKLTQLPDEGVGVSTINTGVLGCKPDDYRDIFQQAIDWSTQITGILSGDQGLTNLAWYQLRGRIPPSHSTLYNGGWHTNNLMVLSQVILHFARPNYPGPGRTKEGDQLAIWSVWPQGRQVTDITQTTFWKSLLPFPWEWPNHCTQPRYRDVVRRCREQSRSLPENQLIAVNTPWQAFLIDSAVLGRIRQEWLQAAGDFARVPHEPTYHLNPYAKPRSAFALTFERLKHELRSRMPR